MLFKLFFLKVIFLILFSCNTTTNENKNNFNPLTEDSTNIILRPSPKVENGECIANKLSFLVGQPDSALDAMEYPLNTRILVVGQVVSDDLDPKRLNLVIGSERRIIFVYCG